MTEDLEARAREWLRSFPRVIDATQIPTRSAADVSPTDLAALLRAVRDEAIEECARECEAYAREKVAAHEGSYGVAFTCASRVRDLKGGG